MIKILTIVGARPQFIKAAALSHAISTTYDRQRSPDIQEILVHTGQHYDSQMSAMLFDELGLPKPSYNLGVGSGSHGRQTGRMLEAIEDIISKENPDCVLVYGDTNSTLAGGLAASKLKVPVAHVEAGLRSFNRVMPEEINRVIIDHLSTLLFCPTSHAVTNLSREGIVQGVSLVGDVMAEVLLMSLPVARRRSNILDRLSISSRSYCLATVHRAENTDDRDKLEMIIAAMRTLDVPVILPCHPRTKNALEKYGLDSLIDGSLIRMIDPVGYLDMVRLESEAKVILTDSGGVQKEAYWLGVHCVTLREETEWTETVEAGMNQLVGTDPYKIREAVRTYWRHAPLPVNIHSTERHVAERVLTLITEHFNGIRQ